MVTDASKISVEHKKLQKKVISLKLKKSQIDLEINKIQEECPHPDSLVTKKYGANTGNYDPHSDFYWTNYHCQICDKWWTEHKEAHRYY